MATLICISLPGQVRKDSLPGSRQESARLGTCGAAWERTPGLLAERGRFLRLSSWHGQARVSFELEVGQGSEAQDVKFWEHSSNLFLLAILFLMFWCDIDNVCV